jgi:hypothetical protein
MASYPDYQGNPQDTSLDVAGDDTIANADDYNLHDQEILAHQDALEDLQAGDQVFPDLRLEDGGKIYLDESGNTYLIYNTTNKKLEIYIEGEKAGYIAVAS